MKEWLSKLTLFVVSTSVTLFVVGAVGEVFLRWHFGGGDSNSHVGFIQHDHTRGWVLVPGNYHFIDLLAYRSASIHINNLGFRDREVALTPETGKERVTILGDSFAFSAALSEEDRFSGRLQHSLGPEYEVVNVSVPGYGTGQEFLFLRDLMRQGFDPGKRVLLVFFTNDIMDNVGLDYDGITPNVFQPDFSGTDANGIRFVDRFPDAADRPSSNPNVFQRSLMFNFVRNNLELVAMRFPWLLDVASAVKLGPRLPRVPGVITGWYVPGWEQRWMVTRRILEHVAAEINGRQGHSLDLVFIPSPFQTEPTLMRIIKNAKETAPILQTFLEDVDRPQRLLSQLSGTLNLRLIDTTPALRSADKAEAAYFPREGHLTEYGSGIVARAIYESLRNGNN